MSDRPALGERAAELRDLAVDVAREAGRLVVRLREEGVDVAATKTSETDVVTEADRASERLIRERILAARPGDGFVGEEGGDSGGDTGGDTGGTGVRWIVDPIDGTVNYLYGLPHFAVSIAAEVDGEVVAGVVVAPALGEEYVATLGGGATRNGRPIAVRPTPSLAQALVGTGFNYEREIRTAQAGYLAKLLPEVRDIRRLGSCALDLCMVASGRLDAYVEEGTQIWDDAAGGLVVREAGGVLEVARAPSGRRLLVCATADAFPAFRGAVVTAGYVAS